MAQDIRSTNVTNLDAVSAAVGSDLVPVERAGRDIRLTAQQIADLGGGGGSVSSVDGRTGAVTLSDLYDALGAAAAAQAASQPSDSDLTAIAALTTQTFGRARLTDVDAAAARTALALGAAALLADPITVAHGGTGATTLTGLVKGSGTSTMTAVTAPSGAVLGDTDTQTLTNKRVTRRAPTVTQSATPTINTDLTDVAHIVGLAQAITSMTTNLSGTPVQGDTLRIDITDDGTGRAITWGASFESSTVTLPTTTVAATRLDVGFFWNTVTSKWRCVAVA